MDDKVVPFRRKPPNPIDPRLARLMRLRAISADQTQMFEVRIMARFQAADLEKEMRLDRARHILRSLLAR